MNPVSVLEGKSVFIYPGLLILIICFACEGLFAKQIYSDESKIYILSNWQYRAGYSPIDSSGLPCWVKDSLNSPEWTYIGSLQNFPGNKDRSIWLRAALPDCRIITPTLYVGQVEQFLQIYLNEKLIYEYGDFSSKENTHTLGFNQNIIPLPDFKRGDILSLRIWSSSEYIGVAGNVSISSTLSIYKNLFWQDVVSLSFVVFFFTGGVIALLIYLFYLRIKLVLSIAIFLLPLSIYIVGNSLYLQALMQTPSLFYQLDFIGLILTTIGGFFAIEQTVKDRYKRIVRTIWQIHLVILIFSIILDLTTRVDYALIFNYFGIVLVINMIINMVVMMLSTKGGQLANKILMIGMTVFLLTATAEVILYFSNLWERVFNYSIRLLHFGALFYVGMLIWIIIYNYLKTNKEKETARINELEAIKRENEANELFSSMLIESQEKERNRIALELHDSVGQKLLLIKNQLLVQLRNLKDNFIQAQLQETCDITGETIQEIRNISQNLRPQHLDQLGLKTAIETLVEKIDVSAEIDLHLSIDNIDGLLPKDSEINFYRIIQESLNNIVKHSKATEARILVKKKEKSIILEIVDNGSGFNSTMLAGFGLTGMKERARILGGEIIIHSSPGTGTRITLEYIF